MRKKTTSKANQKDGMIRIISGQFKGRKLPVKNVTGLRPTTDRVKETVFNWLMQDTREATVLDCFAGSGGLGFECLSRFAKQAHFIELDKLAASQLQQNIATLKLSNAEVINSSAIDVLSNNKDQLTFSLVFVDPPFRKELAQHICELLEQNQWLTDDALIYVEVEKELSLVAPNNWQIIKEKQAGQVLCRLYQRDN
ncbi:Ribosomal RNA small subunit methyltransferase D [Pseudoalteromonas holothuriae]|uniref:Ribosomal RNA small subunit methyltransferase D n=1 Tax=Pseudoalteromonas holothuriae TaxID=2963714 RepID=A0A9W4QW59_9GAMM|nr:MULTISPECIES: 16S rRNA (guanine(966)-N(2))-methyltransferase RsmD [unclassified Pseudoalteromonas]CAH9053167.1 Ribosomal RNA small subunit methyltransferase D [Pseudoalteromonas sp. CIP111951]CAH9056363.1 Ribosomal RNA small subunit methyltransferase D [Pseudoalteromonas sp. CIP111854]